MDAELRPATLRASYERRKDHITRVERLGHISILSEWRRVPYLCIAPFPRGRSIPAFLARGGGRRCCWRNSCPFHTARCVCRCCTRPFDFAQGTPFVKYAK